MIRKLVRVRISIPRVLAGMVAATAIYFLIEFLFLIEYWLAGHIATLDVPQILLETLTVHYFSYLIWLVIIWSMVIAFLRKNIALQKSETRYRNMLESAHEGVWIVDDENRTTFVNERIVEMLGREAGELTGSRIFEFMDGATRAEAQAYFGLRSQGLNKALDATFVRPDGTRLWTILTAAPLNTEANAYTGAMALLTDVTERKQAASALQEANARLQVSVAELQGRTHEITLLSEMGGMLQTCRTAEEAHGVIGQFARRLFPYDSGSVYVFNSSRNLIESVAAWGDAKNGAARTVFGPDDCWALRSGHMYEVDDIRSGIICGHVAIADGAAEPTAYVCVPMSAQGETLGVFHLQSRPANDPAADPDTKLSKSKLDLSVTAAEQIGLALANMRLREALRDQSIRDPLTGLFNRRYMQETLERELRRADRGHSTLAMLMMDIDHFKRFNDTFGHSAGDVVLRALGQLMRSIIRASDIACRFGGEELVLILPDAPLSIATQRAEELRARAEHLDLQMAGLALGAVTLSIGIAMAPEHALTAEGLIEAADVALYRAKKEGRNRIVVSTTIAP